MAGKFNCPQCGAPNEYTGEGNVVRCAYCGQDVTPPTELVNQAAVVRLSSKAKTWLIIFIVVVFVIPACVGFGGTLIGIFASLLGTIAAFLASVIGLLVH